MRLICNGVVIDRMTCTDPLSTARMVESSEQIYALNNGKRKCPPRKISIIAMSLPCSKDLPANCTSQIRSESFDGESTIEAKDDLNDPEGDDDDDTKSTLEAENHGRRKGDICGSKLFGCGFSHDALYTCHAVGEEPVAKQANSSMCDGNGGGGGESTELKGCTCNSTTPVAIPCQSLVSQSPTYPTSTETVCGSELPSACKAEPNTVHICRRGKGSKSEVLAACMSGTMCIKSRSPKGAACGSGTCNCTGDNEICSNAFPDDCGLEKNAVYKCASGGKPELKKSCDTGACVALSSGTDCSSGDCTCPHDADWDMICHCPGGSGTLPKVLDVCKAGSVCLSKPPPEGAACHGEICDCKNATDTCAITMARAKSYLTYVFQMFKAIFANASLGFTATPVLNALQTLVDGFLSATNIDISGTAITAVELMYLLKFVAPASYQVEIQTYTDKIRAF
ncbi:hypothetical protein BGZ74_003661 [Mortierella antarctica]|nr:hypothetical protein BGZ74_003661 [Mortierella antarctica]